MSRHLAALVLGTAGWLVVVGSAIAQSWPGALVGGVMVAVAVAIDTEPVA